MTTRNEVRKGPTEAVLGPGEPVIEPGVGGHWPVRVRRALAGFVDAMLSDVGSTGTLAAPAADERERVVRAVETWAHSGSTNVAFGIRIIIAAVEWLPPLVVGRFSRMSRLPLAERVAYLESLEASRLGPCAMVFAALKLPVVAVAYETGEGLRLTGFDRETLATPRLVRRREVTP